MQLELATAIRDILLARLVLTPVCLTSVSCPALPLPRVVLVLYIQYIQDIQHSTILYETPCGSEARESWRSDKDQDDVHFGNVCAPFFKISLS